MHTCWEVASTRRRYILQCSRLAEKSASCLSGVNAFLWMKSQMSTWEIHWMTSLPCLISQTRSPVLNSIPEGPQILVSGSVSKGEPAISATIFSTNNQCRWNSGRGPRTFGTDKGALFLSTNEIQLVYSCAAFLTVSQVTKQNETFCGHYHGVKNSDHPWVLRGDQLFAFWIPFFDPYITIQLVRQTNFHCKFTQPQTYFYSSVFCFCFSN